MRAGVSRRNRVAGQNRPLQKQRLITLESQSPVNPCLDEWVGARVSYQEAVICLPLSLVFRLGFDFHHGSLWRVSAY